jgi:hypothetical protein
MFINFLFMRTETTSALHLEYPNYLLSSFAIAEDNFNESALLRAKAILKNRSSFYQNNPF